MNASNAGERLPRRATIRDAKDRRAAAVRDAEPGPAVTSATLALEELITLLRKAEESGHLTAACVARIEEDAERRGYLRGVDAGIAQGRAGLARELGVTLPAQRGAALKAV